MQPTTNNQIAAVLRDLVLAVAARNLEKAYPIGTIYENGLTSEPPETLLGFGVWERFGTGRVLVDLDSSQTEFDTLGETGGAKSHTLTTTEMPSHYHRIPDNREIPMFTAGDNPYSYNTSDSGSGINAWRFSPESLATIYETDRVDNTGGGGSHNNLQPYIVVYRWIRTA